MLALALNSWDWWVQFVVSTMFIGGMVWGVIWGAIKIWHTTQNKKLAEKFAPEFTTIKNSISAIMVRFDEQDTVLKSVNHEVTYNNGSSLKDAVRNIARIQGEQVENTKEVVKKVDGVADKLLEHISIHKGIEIGESHG